MTRRALLAGVERTHALARHWLPSIAASILDQGFSSGTNFAIALLVARWCEVEEYGVFAVASSLHLFLAHAYGELMPEPMTVLASSDYAHCLRSYLSALLKAQAWLLFGLALLLALVGAGALLGGRQRLALALLSLALSQSLTLLYSLFRRIAYLRSDAAGAAWASALYALCTLSAMMLFGRRDMSAPRAYFVLGSGAFAAALFLYARLWPRLVDVAPADPPAPAAVLRRHAQFARWTLPSSLSHALGVHALPPVLASSAGLLAAATLRATQNLTTPILQVQGALGTLMLPRLAARRAEAGSAALARAVLRVGLLQCTLSGGYCLLVASFDHELLSLAYGQGTYTRSAWLLDLLLPVVLFNAIAGTCGAGLRAAQAVRAVFWSKAAAGLTACAVGLPLAMMYGLVGVGWALLVTSAAEATVSAAFFFRIQSSQRR